MVEDKTCPIEIDLAEPLPAVLDLGAAFCVVIAVTAGSGCDLADAAFKVLDGDKIVTEGVLPQFARHDPNSNDYDPRNGPVETRDTASIALTAPDKIGAFQWTLMLTAQQIGGVDCAEASLTFSFCTGEHKTSLAVWDVPSPVVAGENFSVKVAAKCTAGCDLVGQPLELRDEAGRVVATETLNERWPGAESLYWTALETTAPADQGFREWSISFSAHVPGRPHQGNTASVSFMTVAQGVHEVAVAIVERETAVPIGDAQVRLGFHRTATNVTGVARFLVPPGKHRLFVWKAGYAMPERLVEVEHNLDLRVEAEVLPKPDPYAYWQG